MKRFPSHLAALALLAGAALTTPAHAQMSNMMPSMSGGGSMGSSMGSMMGGGSSGLAMPSLQSAPPTNIAGLLQFCVKNNYLGGGEAGAATSAKQSLLSKFTGSSQDPSSDSGFSSGSSGLLDTGNGNTANLNGGGLKAQLTQKLCGQVLSHAKTLM